MRRFLLAQVVALLLLGSFHATALADTVSPTSDKQWWCLGEAPCPEPTDSSLVDGSADTLEYEAAIPLTSVIGAIQTDFIWKYSQTLPYSLCDANGCRQVGKVLASAQLTLNGEVQRSLMSARATEGPRIRASLYRRCRATNGGFPDTTCGEATDTSPDYRGTTQTYSQTRNYTTTDDGDYYYQFNWSWEVEGFSGKPSSGVGNSQTFNCSGTTCRFP